MTTKENTAEKPADEVEDIEQEAEAGSDTGEIANEGADNISVEERARAMGWIPQDEYRGDKNRWVSADEFVRKGEEEMPVLRDTVRRLSREVVESKKIFEKAQKFQENAHKREIDRIKKEKLEAVESGDTAAYKELEREESEMMKDAPVDAPAPSGLSAHDKQAMDEWANANPWFMNDKELNIEMVSAFGAVEGLHPAADLPTKLRLARERVARLHPIKFGNPNRSRPSAVESGTNKAGRGGGKTYNDLPNGDRKLCDDFVRRGIMTRESYVKQYDWEEK